MTGARQSKRCPTPLELERAYWEGHEVVARHARTCEACAAEWRGLEELAALAAPDEVPLLAADRQEALRTRMLSAAQSATPVGGRPSRARYAVAAALSIAAVVAAIVLIRGRGGAPGESSPARLAAVIPIGGASYSLESAQPDERVRLVEGTVRVDVARLSSGQRFRVVTNMGEVEVYGTIFEVAAFRGELVAVRVLQGEVIVRMPDAAPVSLHTGQAWPVRAASGDASATATPPAPTIAAERAVQTPVPVAPPARRRKANLDAGHASTATAVVTPRKATFYDSAWTLLRAKNYRAAARSFEKAAESGSAHTREDALYWAGVARSRAGERRDARANFERFLAEYPASPRVGEVSAILGWNLFDARKYREAERRFRAASKDADRRVRESAQKGLTALDRL